MEILRILVIIFIFGLSSSGRAQNNSADTYFIDIADETFSQVSCEDCPDNVGKMIIARPMTLGEMEDPSDIQLNTCHFTLIEPNVIQTASHCAFPWTLGEWNNDAQGDCSKTFGFYLPGGRVARCEEIISDSEASPNLKHTRPDTVLMRIDKSFDLETPTTSESGVYQIWGSMDDQHILEKRTCQIVRKSILSPLRIVGIKESGFMTLTCDGPIIKGFSGAGVFKDGALVGNISQAISETPFSPSVFGNNEVTVSIQSCSPLLETGMSQVPAHCFSSNNVFDQAVQESHFRPLDGETQWQDEMIKRFEGSLTGIRFSYSTRQNQEVLKERGFKTQCVTSSFHQAQSVEGVIVTFIRLQTEKMHEKFVHYGDSTEIVGYWGMYEKDPVVGSFFVNLDFEKVKYQKVEEGLRLNQEGFPLIPLCE